MLLLLIVGVVLCGHASGVQEAGPPAASATDHYISPQALPPPFHTKSAVNPPKIVPPPPDVELTAPKGFRVEVWAEGGMERPRWLALAPNGDVFVAEANGSRISILRDSNDDGKADERFVFADDIPLPFGMAFWNDYLYVGRAGAVERYSYQPGQTRAKGEPEIIAELPGRTLRDHWTRNLIFNRQGTKLYVAVGSLTNVDVEDEPRRAAINEYNPDGSGHRIFANGLRNPVGLAWQPGTDILWTSVNERDGLGDDLAPDYVTSVREGGFYGWPYSYIGGHEDPRRAGERPDLVEKAIVPDVLIQAHSAALGLIFYQGEMFPREYRGGAFVALRGSWNRSERTGYKIIHIPFRKGKPVAGYNDFITGWVLGPEEKEVWGRPVGLLELPDGSILIADDTAEKILRVSYHGSAESDSGRNEPLGVHQAH